MPAVPVGEIKRELNAMLTQLEEARAAIERVLADLDYMEGLDATIGDLENARMTIEDIMGKMGAIIQSLEG